MLLAAVAAGALCLAAQPAEGEPQPRAVGALAPTGAPETQAQVQALDVEEQIAACMLARGWQYQAAVPTAVLVDEALTQSAAPGRDIEDAVQQVLADRPADPNDALRLTLSPTEVAAYDSAVVECREALSPEAQGLTPEELGAQIRPPGVPEDIVGYIMAQPSMKSAAERFRGCVTTAGFPAPDPNTFLNTYITVDVEGQGTPEQQATQHHTMAVFDSCTIDYDAVYEEYLRAYDLAD